jgi:hypothetical protein
VGPEALVEDLVKRVPADRPRVGLGVKDRADLLPVGQVAKVPEAPRLADLADLADHKAVPRRVSDRIVGLTKKSSES